MGAVGASLISVKTIQFTGPSSVLPWLQAACRSRSRLYPRLSVGCYEPNSKGCGRRLAYICSEYLWLVARLILHS